MLEFPSCLLAYCFHAGERGVTKLLNFEVIIDSYAGARNNTERSVYPDPRFPYGNILQNYV